MIRIDINTNHPYSVLLEEGLLYRIGEYAAQCISGKSIALIFDKHIPSEILEHAESSLKRKGYAVFSYGIASGEQSKNPNTLLSVLSFLAESGITRSDAVIALGGGVTGDIAGFASAVYMRGISLIQIPTTLTAMIDSSIGGKNGIDLPEGKNMIGTFKQPDLVLIDPSLLTFLPEPILQDGFGEAIKYAVLIGDSLESELLKDNPDYVRIIEICVRYKAELVSKDEFDRNERHLLNLGHTVGHAIEASSDYTFTHGKAVVIGLLIAAEIACALGIADASTVSRINSLLAKYQLPTALPCQADKIENAIRFDKKRTDTGIRVILPEHFGRCVQKEFSLQEYLQILHEVLTV